MLNINIQLLVVHIINKLIVLWLTMVIYLFTVLYIAHFPRFKAQMRCTSYEMARYKGTHYVNQ